MHRATSRLENSAKSSTLQLQFVHVFVYKAGAYLSGAPYSVYRGRLLALPTNVRLSTKYLARTYNLDVNFINIIHA
jgi:hypothetical protein